jgi:O-antigen ligase
MTADHLELALLAIGAISIAFIVATVFATHFGVVALSRVILWIGLLGPIWIAQSQSNLSNAPGSSAATSIGNANGTTGNLTSDVARVVLPLLCLALAWLLTRPRSLRPGRVEFLYLAYGVFALVSVLWSVDRTATLEKAVTLVVAIVVVWELLRRYESAGAVVRGVANYVHFTLILVAAEIPFAWHRSFNVAGGLNPNRLSGAFPQYSPDILSTIAAVGVLAVLFGVGPRWLVEHRWRRVVFGLLYAAELIAAGTRSVAAIAGIVIIVIVVARSWRTHRRTVIGCIVLACVAVAALSPKLVSYLHRGQSGTQVVQLNGRAQKWDAGLRAWEQSPLVGDGYFAGHRYKIYVPNVGAYAAHPQNLDETWLEALVDVGLVGAALLAAFVVAGIARIVTSRQLWERNEWIFACAVCLLYVPQSFLNPTVESNDYANWAIWGLILVAMAATQGSADAQAATSVASVSSLQ